jgi:hypothetical protein
MIVGIALFGITVTAVLTVLILVIQVHWLILIPLAWLLGAVFRPLFGRLFDWMQDDVAK